MPIKPIELKGIWDEGYALDMHLISSEYIGEDVYGNKRFTNQHTELGGLLYKMKYNGRLDTSEEMLELVRHFLDEWMNDKTIDIILPVPPTKKRDMQPIFIITEAISAHCGIPYSLDVLIKDTDEQSKNIDKTDKDLTGSILLQKKAKRRCNILLVDDLFSTGATATECVAVLKTDPLINKVFLLAMTKTR